MGTTRVLQGLWVLGFKGSFPWYYNKGHYRVKLGFIVVGCRAWGSGSSTPDSALPAAVQPSAGVKGHRNTT